jgi:hypothetical protein
MLMNKAVFCVDVNLIFLKNKLGPKDDPHMNLAKNLK